MTMMMMIQLSVDEQASTFNIGYSTRTAVTVHATERSAAAATTTTTTTAAAAALLTRRDGGC